MGSDQFVELKDVPDIYTDSGSDSSDESIKALLTSKSSRAGSTDGESVKSTPSKTPSVTADKPTKTKKEKAEGSPKPKKSPVKRDLEKPSDPKPKKPKQSKPKAAKEAEKPKDAAESVPKEAKETPKTEETQKTPKSPKVKSAPPPKAESSDPAQKEVTETPKKKKSKPKTPKATTPQESDKELGKDVAPKEKEKKESLEKQKESPKRKKELEKDSSPKPKKPKASKPKKTKEITEEVPEKTKDEKQEKVEVVKETVEETMKNKEEDSDKEFEGTMEVLKKLSNREVFDSLLKKKTGAEPAEELKAKMLTLTESDSESSETSSESDSESSDSDAESDDVFIKPKLPSVKFDIKDESEDEESEEEEQVTPKPKLTPKEEIPVVTSEHFVNKERLHKTQKPVIDIPPGCEIYCGNLPVNITEEELRELFEECGAITRINKLNKKGIAFITFSNEESAQKASEYNNSPYKGQLLNINITTNRPGKKDFKKPGKEGTWAKDKGENSPTNEVCIRNLNFNSTEEGLRELFGECGQVTRCYLPKFQDSGKPMGICFITFTTVEAAKRAVEYDRTEIDGRTVSIQYAQPRGARSGMRGRALKGRFTTSNPRVATFSRPFGSGSNKTNGSFKEKKNGTHEGDNCDHGLTNVGFVGEESKPKSIIFEDSDSE